ncbi:hypothetical protein BASA83_010241 [Batrachochytrium salamandrivorans]|nr:hypothetical protein BASA83_010241 [Batrachochytrium salamandrivorans]
MAAEVTSAIQDDGVTPTVTPIADVEMCFRLNHIPPLHSRSNTGHQMEHVSKIDRRTTKHGARFRITVPETDNATSSSASSAKASKLTGVFGKTTDIAVQTSLDQQPHLQPLSRQILAVNVANISNKRPAIRHIVRNTRLWAISETCITSSKFRFTVPGFDVIQHPATGPGRRGIALVGSVYVGHSGATTNYSRREAFASIRQPSTELFHLTTTILFSFSETGTPTHSAFSALSTRGVMV